MIVCFPRKRSLVCSLSSLGLRYYGNAARRRVGSRIAQITGD
jgi:hypothetical protein